MHIHCMVTYRLFLLKEKACFSLINMFMIYFSNKITRDGVERLAELLKTNTTLEILDLTSNRMEDEGAIHLAKTIHTYKSSLKA